MASRTWFRHDDNLRFDEAIEKLCDEFGPLGDLAWRRLLEVRSQEGKDLVYSIRQLEKIMNLRETWGLDLAAWLTRARDLRLITARKKSRDKKGSRDVLWCIALRKWEEKQQERERKEKERERKRRQRAGLSQGDDEPVPGDAESVPGDEDTHTDVTPTDEPEEHVGSARESQGSDVESVSNDDAGDRAQQGREQAPGFETRSGNGMTKLGDELPAVLGDAKKTSA